MSNVPNLDCIAESELLAFATFYENIRNRYDAAELIGDKRKGYMNHARNLGHYARNKHVAMQCRARGDIQAAQNYEKICEMIYYRLPADLRW